MYKKKSKFEITMRNKDKLIFIENTHVFQEISSI